MTLASDKFNAVEITSDDPDYIKYKFTEKAPPNREFIVSIGELYPIRSRPIIYHNGKYIGVKDHNPGLKIIDILNQYIMSPEKPNKALVLCHPKFVTGSFSPLRLDNHHLGWISETRGKSPFEEIFSKYGLSGEVDFETVDVTIGGTYQADAFSDAFIESHTNEYDMVLVPDCDGKFIQLQMNVKVAKPYIKDVQPGTVEFKPIEEYNEDITKFITLCLKLGQMVKKGGLIYFAKLSNESIAEKLLTTMNEHGFETEFVRYSGVYVVPSMGAIQGYIVAKKL